MAHIALFIFTSLLALTFTAGGCSRKSPPAATQPHPPAATQPHPPAATQVGAGFEPVFRQEYPGAPCKDLKVETGSYESVCSRSPAWAAACPFGWKDLENTQIAIIHGPYEGPICLLSHDECDKPERIDFVGAALRIGNGNWDPGGQLVIDGRRIDVRITLQVGCGKPANPPKK